jgi:H+/Cl- antiporter ClcA
MAEQTTQPLTQDDVNKIMSELKHIKRELKNAEVRDKEIYYMAITAASMTLVAAGLANRIMRITVPNLFTWDNTIMIIVGVIFAVIAWYKYYRFKHNQKAD